MTPPNAFLSSLLVKWVCVHFFFVPIKVSNHTYLKMRVSTECPKFCPLEGLLPLYKWTTFSDALIKGLLLLLLLLLSRRPGFSRFVEATVSRCTPEGLPFALNVVGILWTVLVFFHGRLGRFEAHIIEVLFLLAQLWTVTHHPRIIKVHSETVGSIQWWYLYWVIILNSFLQF